MKTGGVSAFQQRVYDALSSVPSGRVVTYHGLARLAGCASARAVGQALRRNPFAPAVPCHRVIASDLTIGGYGGDTLGPRVRRKLQLLAEEGVRFRDGRLLEPERVLVQSLPHAPTRRQD